MKKLYHRFLLKSPVVENFLPASWKWLNSQVSDSLLVIWNEAFPEVTGSGPLQVGQGQAKLIEGFIQIRLVFHIETVSGQ